MLMAQHKLECEGVYLVTWLPKDKRVKEGTRLSLDKDDRIWTVVKQYAPMDSSQIQRGWNVGGISTVL